MLSVIENLFGKVLVGEQVTTDDKAVYESLCKMLDDNNVDYVSGDIDHRYPDEPYYVELNGTSGLLL